MGRKEPEEEECSFAFVNIRKIIYGKSRGRERGIRKVIYLTVTHAHHVKVGKLIFVADIAAFRAPGDFPKNESHGVDVGALERLEMMNVDRIVQDLGCHVSAYEECRE